MQAGELTPIQAVQTRGRWRWWALVIVALVVVAAVVGAVIAIGRAADDAAGLTTTVTLVVRGLAV